LKYYQVAPSYPPSHPLPHEVQQAVKSFEDTLVYLVYPEAIQILSLKASTAPNAQQLPQSD